MDFDVIFQEINLNTALAFPLEKLRSQNPSSVYSTPSEVSAILCVLFGNPLRTLFLKNGDIFCYGQIFIPIRGDL